MERLVVAVIVLAALSALVGGGGAAVARKGKGRKRREGRSGVDVQQYERIGGLLSPAELNFYRLLVKVLAHPSEPGGAAQAVVMAKVRACDLVRVRKGLDRSAWRGAFNRIKAKHVDFVLCDPGTMRAVCVIELDDSSHRRGGRSERDALMDSIYSSAGLAVVHVDCRRGYSMQEVGGMIREAVGRKA